MAVRFTGDVERIGQGYGFHEYQVENLAALTALPTALWPDGNVVRVATIKCLFVLETTAAAAVDEEVVASSEAGRKWMRQSMSLDKANPWAIQTEWYVHPSTGDDEALGTLGSPLRTIKEVTRRLRGTIIAQNTFIYLLAGGAVLAETANLAVGSILAIDGRLATTTVLTTVVGTYTALSDLDNEWFLLTLSGVSDMTPYIGKRVRITSGPRQYAYCWIVKANPNSLGLNVARISWPVVLIPEAVGTEASTPWEAGDEVVVEDLPALTYITGTRLWNRGQLRNCALPNIALTGLVDSGGGPSILACRLQAGLANINVYGSCFVPTGFVNVQGFQIPVGVYTSAIIGGLGFSVSVCNLLYSIIQSTTLSILGTCSFYVPLGVWDAPIGEPAINLTPTANITVRAVGRIMGKGNLHLGAFFAEGSRMVLVAGGPSLPSITGALGDFAVSQYPVYDAMSWSQYPYWNELVQAGIVGPSPWTDVSLSTDAPIAVATWTVTGFPASKRFLAPINIDVHVWSVTEEGSISCALDVIVTTDGDGDATLSLNTTPVPDYSRLPAGFEPTMDVAVDDNVLTVSITRPAGVACKARATIDFDRTIELRTI